MLFSRVRDIYRALNLNSAYGNCIMGNKIAQEVAAYNERLYTEHVAHISHTYVCTYTTDTKIYMSQVDAINVPELFHKMSKLQGIIELVHSHYPHPVQNHIDLINRIYILYCAGIIIVSVAL